ncbi:PilZ domain-containing protein [Hoeflea sp. AS16]|jgi:PilZ domain-containing protein|uniref:PilZ domain-containing protein n=1 Tax=Hoeflea sp. AS16 TaxID=3135779 RepID=UPI0031794B0E
MTGMTGRAIKRDKTRVKARIDCMGQKTGGAVIDLSPQGICLQLDAHIPTARGDKINVETEEMGLLIGTIRWIRGSRIGAALVLTSNNRAKVESYYKMFLHNRQPA